MRRAHVVFVAFALVTPAFADVVELKSGEKLQGKVKSVTPVEVVVDVGGKETKVERDKVRAITLDTAAPPKPPPPAVVKDAMAALRTAQSIAGPGAIHVDYAEAVSTADLSVGRALRDPEDAAAKAAMKDAVGLHQFALTAWETRLRTFGYQALESDPAAEKCAGLKKVLEREEKAVAEENARIKARFERKSKAREAAKEPPPPEPPPVVYEAGQVIATKGLSAIWACAGDKIAEAQKLLDSPPPTKK